jgi:hypothetical protein
MNFPSGITRGHMMKGKRLESKGGFEALWCIFKYNVMIKKDDYCLPGMPEKYMNTKACIGKLSTF